MLKAQASELLATVSDMQCINTQPSQKEWYGASVIVLMLAMAFVLGVVTGLLMCCCCKRRAKVMGAGDTYAAHVAIMRYLTQQLRDLSLGEEEIVNVLEENPEEVRAGGSPRVTLMRYLINMLREKALSKDEVAKLLAEDPDDEQDTQNLEG